MRKYIFRICYLFQQTVIFCWVLFGIQVIIPCNETNSFFFFIRPSVWNCQKNIPLVRFEGTFNRIQKLISTVLRNSSGTQENDVHYTLVLLQVQIHGIDEGLPWWFMKYGQIHISKLEHHSNAGESQTKELSVENGKAKRKYEKVQNVYKIMT